VEELYSVIAYAVSQRTPEIGIRMALGAQARQVVGMVLGSGLRLVAVGLALGLVAAAGATRLIRTLLFRIEPIRSFMRSWRRSSSSSPRSHVSRPRSARRG
jgi:ABC-type antimicrobial peptide transport system permease subunit